eukprot:CAMPEP_0178436070 /NCGR_PEP_ID=MMETSP0689_2-20121128/34252_1 /TAXON_ID=160604 /ORGANISM="Amphidinium massartii, Strain CS-259" /LENGTH=625 /DNA_ID=CAMNT_0020058159 /DNA_START=15 /DNA_END=1892 /DNA_ORIENTATION=+
MPVGRTGQWRNDYGTEHGMEFGPDARPIDQEHGLRAYTMESHCPDPGPKGQVYAGRGHGETASLLWKTSGARCCMCFPARWGKLWPDVVVPWLFFVLMMYPFGLPWAKAYAAPFILALFAFLSGFFLWASRSTAWKLFGLLCLVCSLVGLYLGYDNYTRYLNDYYIYYHSRHYSNVLPSGNPGATKDAGSMVFAAGSFVDSSMTVGYRSGALYCVAPVVARDDLSGSSDNSTSSSSSAAAPSVGYWAVGTDCCRVRSDFQCGDAMLSDVRSGLVVIDEPSHSEKLEKWRAAAALAASTYGLSLPSDPTFVYWLDDTEGAIAQQQEMAQSTYLRWIFIGLLPIILVAVLLLWRGTDSMHKKELRQMEYACGWCSVFCEPRRSEAANPDVVRDLLHKRAYWSGEVAHDWWFYVCNDHDFVGMLLCHPAHPYSKLERVMTFVIVSAITFLAATALTEWLSSSSWSRWAPIIVLLLVTLPMKAIVEALKKNFVRDAEMLLDDGRALEDAEAAHKQSIFLGVAAVIVGIIVGVVSSRVLSSYSVSANYAIRLYVTTELFRAVTQLAIELVMPKYVPADRLLGASGQSQSAKSGRLYFGFVHRWLSEQKDFLNKPTRYGDDSAKETGSSPF